MVDILERTVYPLVWFDVLYELWCAFFSTLAEIDVFVKMI